jgi:hypothetical protein
MSRDNPRPWQASTLQTLVKNPHFSVLLQNVIVPDGTAQTYYTIQFLAPIRFQASDALLCLLRMQ